MTLATFGTFLKQNWLTLLLLGSVLGFIGLHLIWYIRPSNIKTFQALQARLQDGQPTIVEFYSNL